MAIQFELPQLGYDYDALEPYIDAKTMEIHYTKHHQAYTDKFNQALSEIPDIKYESAEDIVRNLKEIPEAHRAAIQNHGGGYINHKFFWSILKKTESRPSGDISLKIDETFGGFDEFKQKFSTAATTRFGSGWAWLVQDGNTLEIISTPNQDSPLALDKSPLLGLDVWEHAYYLKYQNRRADYIEAFFQVVDWDRVNQYLNSR
jgi:Fe-Mn family superoxide dismutase